MRIGLLHPGAMGAAIGATLVDAGNEVLWRPQGRSEATRRRAEAAGLVASGDLDGAELVLSVCPPGAALEVARSLRGSSALVIDANAISPATAREVGGLVGPRWADGGIVGPPPREAGTTRLFLSGDLAGEAAAAFAGTVLETVVLPGSPAAASALKMAYGGWTKGATALLLSVYASARAEGVDAALQQEWLRSQPELPDRLEAAAADAASKGWRWVAEMREVAATLGSEGLPAGFHEAAAVVFERASEAQGGDLDAIFALLRDGADGDEALTPEVAGPGPVTLVAAATAWWRRIKLG